MSDLNTLSGMPGDLVDWRSSDHSAGGNGDVIESAGFMPAPNNKIGSKIWTYRMISGAIVPHDCVTNLTKVGQKTLDEQFAQGLEPDDEVMSDQWDVEQEQKKLRAKISHDVTLLNISNETKLAIACLLNDEFATNEIAAEMIRRRRIILMEMTQGHHKIATKPE